MQSTLYSAFASHHKAPLLSTSIEPIVTLNRRRIRHDAVITTNAVRPLPISDACQLSRTLSAATGNCVVAHETVLKHPEERRELDGEE